MKLSQKEKILGGITVAAAILVIAVALYFTPSIENKVPVSKSVLTEESTSEIVTSSEVSTETTTEVQTTTTATAVVTTAAAEYTVQNYIILMNNSAMEIYGINKPALLDYAATINTLANKLPFVQVYCLLAPTRVEFYGPEKYHTGSSSQKAGIKIAYDALNSNVIKVDAWSALSEKTDEYIYFRTDHHWTARGAYYAYNAFTKSAVLPNCQPLSAYETGRLDGFVGTMYGYTQSEVLKNNPDYVEYFMPLNGATGQYFSTPEMNDGKDLKIISTSITKENAKYMAFIQGDKALSKITTNLTNGKSILLIKESYGNSFAPFLTENYQEIYVLDPRKEGVCEMDLDQFITDHNIHEVLFLNYSFATSNKPFMNPLKNIVNK